MTKTRDRRPVLSRTTFVISSQLAWIGLVSSTREVGHITAACRDQLIQRGIEQVLLAQLVDPEVLERGDAGGLLLEVGDPGAQEPDIGDSQVQAVGHQAACCLPARASLAT